MLALLVALSWVLLAPAERADAKRPFLVRNGTSDFDRYLTNASKRQKSWMRRHYFQMRGWSPFFEQKAMRWRPPPTMLSKDLYAIYNPSEAHLIEQHPDWVLRDADGRPLYIGTHCNGETCTQYAADFGHPEWRAHWIATAGESLARAARRDPRGRGYIGLNIDDVNLEFRATNEAGEQVTPIDPRTGEPMTLDAWQGYQASFVEEIRAAFPSLQINHNHLWWLPHDDPEVRRQVAAADWIQLERGFNDAGLTPGGGLFGFETFMDHIDWLHAQGKSVVYQVYLTSDRMTRYELAGYFLVRKGRDAIATDWRTDPPADGKGLWRGWRVDPGRPRGKRRKGGDGLWRRKFAHGMAVVNPVGGGTERVRFKRPHTSIGGKTSKRFKLGGGTGDVYVR